jgi:hypothetical protein
VTDEARRRALRIFALSDWSKLFSPSEELCPLSLGVVSFEDISMTCIEDLFAALLGSIVRKGDRSVSEEDRPVNFGGDPSDFLERKPA